ncbi:MAG TPA: type VI secretion system tube protein Hcp [Planctomycetaceae bacterium]|nr:type VI secretion system tube protein Hcp [Planctomycetaceae bacterium]
MPFLFMQSPSLSGTYPLDTADDKTKVKAKLDPSKLIKIDSLSHTMTVPVAPLRPSFSKASFRTGTVEHNPVIVRRTVDECSIKLLDCFLKETVMEVVQILAGVPVNDKDLLSQTAITMAPQWIMRFQNAFISNYACQSAPDGGLIEEVTVRYAAVGWGFSPQKNDKSLMTATVTYAKLDNEVASAWPSEVGSCDKFKGTASKFPSDDKQYFTEHFWK